MHLLSVCRYLRCRTVTYRQHRLRRVHANTTGTAHPPVTSKSGFRLFNGDDLELDNYRFVVAPHHHEVSGLAGAKVRLLMRHIGGEVDEIARSYFRCELKSLAPANFAAPFHYVNRNLVTAVMVRARFRVWLKND